MTKQQTVCTTDHSFEWNLRLQENGLLRVLVRMLRNKPPEMEDRDYYPLVLDMTQEEAGHLADALNLVVRRFQ